MKICCSGDWRVHRIVSGRGDTYITRVVDVLPAHSAVGRARVAEGLRGGGRGGPVIRHRRCPRAAPPASPRLLRGGERAARGVAITRAKLSDSTPARPDGARHFREATSLREGAVVARLSERWVWVSEKNVYRDDLELYY